MNQVYVVQDNTCVNNNNNVNVIAKDLNMKPVSFKVLTALQIAMGIHAILDLAGAIILFIDPSILQSLAPNFVLEPALTRIIAGALTAITYSSAVASQFTRTRQFVPLLQFKSVWSTTVWLGLFITAIEILFAGQTVNILVWFSYYTFITGSILWNTFLILLRRNNIISIIIIILAVLSVFIVNIIKIVL